MKNFFHLTVSIILGSFLGYSLYYKILKKNTTLEANNIAVDELFFADNAAFEKKQQEAFALSRNHTSYADTLQVSVHLFETSQPVKSTNVAARNLEVKPIKIIETMQPIEVTQLQKPKIISIPVGELAAPNVGEMASADVATSVQEVSASITTAQAETESGSQEQVDKKRFLFFNKKSKNN